MASRLNKTKFGENLIERGSDSKSVTGQKQKVRWRSLNEEFCNWNQLKIMICIEKTYDFSIVFVGQH